MIGFINERSLGQYGDWVASLRFFLEAARTISTAGYPMFKDSRFFSRGDVIQRFNSLSFPKDERALMQQLAFGSQYYRCWTQNRVSIATESYACADPALALLDESLAEAAERSMKQAAEGVSVLSAPDSAGFQSKDRLSISKPASGQVAELRNASSVEGITRWIVSEQGYYNPNSPTAPRDLQTVLVKAADRFRKTGKVERRSSRSVFEERATGRLFHVDEGHPGHSAHLEVFSANFEHLGTADINTGTLNVAGRVEGRRLRL